MRTHLIFILLSICIVSSCAAPAKPYAFHPEPFSNLSHAQITGNPGFGNGLIVILKIDGEKTKTHSDIPAEIREKDKNLFLPSAITVPAGKHALGVGYVFGDISGKLVTSKMADAYEKLFLPKEKRDYITVWHYEEFEITTKNGMNYQLGREYDEKNKRVRILVNECAAKNQCTPVVIIPANVKDNAYSGMPTPGILDEYK
jgi:hypothetical protein